MTRPVVLIESPYSGHGTEAIRYLACCLLDSILRGEAPIASHGLYPLSLPERCGDYGGKTGRDLGLECRAALSMLHKPVEGEEPAPILVIAYVDLGRTSGMSNAPGRQIQLYRNLRGEAKRIWESGAWPTEARWTSTNEAAVSK